MYDFEFYWSDIDRYGKLYDLKIPAGYYDNPVLLCDYLNDLIEKLNIDKLKSKQLFQYNKITKKFTIDVKDLYITLIIKGQLIDLLGLELRVYKEYQASFLGLPKEKTFYMYDGKIRYFKNQEIEWQTDSLDGGTCPFVSQMVTVSSFLIYTNIISDVIMGNNYAKCLRNCAIDGQPGTRVVKVFQKRMYLPVGLSNIHAISITINDFQGRPMNFLEGNVSVVLHFRKKKL